MSTTDYHRQFEIANDFIGSLGLQRVLLPALEGELVTPEYGQKVMNKIQAAGIRSFKRSAMQCLKWSHALRPLVEEAMGCPVVLTVGQLYFCGKTVFDPSKEDFVRWYRQGFQIDDFRSRLGFNLHAWYTLPTMEVLDLTICSSIAAARETPTPEMEGVVIGGWPDLMAPTHHYIPMSIGHEYIEQVAHKSRVPLLATGLSQAALDALPVVMMLDR